MNRRSLFVAGTLIISTVIIALMLASSRRDQPAWTELIAHDTTLQRFDAYSRAAPGESLNFPADYGPHDDYLTEWWYYTGNLRGDDGSRFGYQLTFFRRALSLPDMEEARSSNWATGQIYLAHFALSDIGSEDFYAFERFSRAAAGLAGAQADPYRVWLYDWSVVETTPGIYQLHASEIGIAIDLTLEDTKGLVFQGVDGYSQKGPDPGNASYYYSQTRLDSRGSIDVGGNRYQVSGFSWMDHEFSTSALTVEQVGWDWFSIQLEDNVELMLFQIRREDGSIDPFSSGTFVAADGGTVTITREDFFITSADTWESPHSGAVYPAGWKISIPSIEMRLRVEPLQEDQELNLTYTYWEGAVSVEGEYQGQPVTGNGYVELTGYAGSFAGEF